jgi:NAD(P)-dependent dehydrogenase (short-subunit alcohol dehydrogenase family)
LNASTVEIVVCLSFQQKPESLKSGASSGIGKVSALAFAREGAKVTIAARRIEQGTQTVKEIKEEGRDVFFIQTDVSKTQDVLTMVAMTIKTYGRLINLIHVCRTTPIRRTPQS